mmetsp:Transcript_5643/g.18012  ORF Transcript_5643/g.18012 Transcript_5643/m.18012 type:complete len:242 (-) Transcript_5643:128-853(-)
MVRISADTRRAQESEQRICTLQSAPGAPSHTESKAVTGPSKFLVVQESCTMPVPPPTGYTSPHSNASFPGCRASEKSACSLTVAAQTVANATANTVGSGQGERKKRTQTARKWRRASTNKNMAMLAQAMDTKTTTKGAIELTGLQYLSRTVVPLSGGFSVYDVQYDGPWEHTLPSSTASHASVCPPSHPTTAITSAVKNTDFAHMEKSCSMSTERKPQNMRFSLPPWLRSEPRPCGSGPDP